MLFSHSRLSSFENCPKQFHFRYIRKIPQETEGIEAFVGKRVHEILERLYQFVDRGQVPSLEKVLARYQALWDEHYDAARVRVVREGTPVRHYLELGERCIRMFYRRHYPFDADETLGLEQRVIFSLDEADEYRVQGIIDRVVRAPDGAIEIQDYKTGARVPSQKNLDVDRQLALYQIGLTRQYGDHERFRLVWHYVAKGQVRTSARSPEQLDALQKDTIGLIDRIQAETEYAPRKIALCDWCEYKPMCPLWGGTERAEAAPPAAEVRAASAKPEPAVPPGQLDLL